MKEITKKWMAFAKADMAAAEVQFQFGEKKGSSYQIAVFHCHQAVEKMLKASLAEQGKEIPKLHNLVRLLALIEFSIPADSTLFVEDLNPHYLPPRYPDLGFHPKFSFTYNRKNVATIIKQTRIIILWLEKNIQVK